MKCGLKYLIAVTSVLLPLGAKADLVNSTGLYRPCIEQPQIQKPLRELPDVDKPNIAKPLLDKPDIDRPLVDKAVIVKPLIDKPEVIQPQFDNCRELTPAQNAFKTRYPLINSGTSATRAGYSFSPNKFKFDNAPAGDRLPTVATSCCGNVPAR